MTQIKFKNKEIIKVNESFTDIAKWLSGKGVNFMMLELTHGKKVIININDIQTVVE